MPHVCTCDDGCHPESFADSCKFEAQVAALTEERDSLVAAVSQISGPENDYIAVRRERYDRLRELAQAEVDAARSEYLYSTSIAAQNLAARTDALAAHLTDEGQRVEEGKP